MRIRRVGYDEASEAVVYVARRGSSDYLVLVRVESMTTLSIKVLDKQSGRLIYEGQAPEFGDRGESNDDFIGSLWWAERMIDECASKEG